MQEAFKKIVDMKYKVGDKVRIVNERTDKMNIEGKMNCWLGKIMTIDRITAGTWYRMQEDNGAWLWDDNMIAGPAEPEMSAEEVLEMIKEICDESSCSECPFSNRKVGCICRESYFAPKEIIKACEQWKADHEKKEPEVEMKWFWQGRIFEIKDQDRNNYYQIKDGTGFYDTGCESRESAEEYMTNTLKEYNKSHEGDYIAVVEHVCRVKAVE